MSHQRTPSNLRPSVDSSSVHPTTESQPPYRSVVAPATSQPSTAQAPLKRSHSKIEKADESTVFESSDGGSSDSEPPFKKPWTPTTLTVSTNRNERPSQATGDNATPSALARQPSGGSRKENAPILSSVVAPSRTTSYKLDAISANGTAQSGHPGISRAATKLGRPRAHTFSSSVHTPREESHIPTTPLLPPPKLDLSPLTSPDDATKDALSSKVLPRGRARSNSAPEPVATLSQEEEAAMGLVKLRVQLAQLAPQRQVAQQLRHDAALGMVKLQVPLVFEQPSVVESGQKRCKDCGHVYGAELERTQIEPYSAEKATRPTTAGIRPRCTSYHGPDQEFAEHEDPEPVLDQPENEFDDDNDDDPDWEPSASQDSSSSDA